MAFGDKFSRCCKIALLVTGGLQSAANSMDLDLFPLGRVNAEQRQAYVGSSTGIEAIRLDTGETEWTRPPGAQVVCLWKEQVVALLPAGRTAIRVAWLDARTGLVTLRSAPATFPMGVDWSQAQFRCVREGTALLLRWEAMSAYRGGASPKSGTKPGLLRAERTATSARMKSPKFVAFACVSALAVGLFSGCTTVKTAGTGASFKGPIGLQLYSLRGDFSKDVPGTMAKVRGFGFKYVELAGTYVRLRLVAHRMVPTIA